MTDDPEADSCALPESSAIAAILAFSGSSDRGSLSGRLLDGAVGFIAGLDADVSLLDLRDLDLPLFDPDRIPSEWPQGVRVFRQLLSAHDGLVIATPEYNGSLPPLLKNALDWSSLGGPGAFSPHRGKVAAIMSATAGDVPPVHCLDHLRTVLSTMGVFVIPEQIALASAEALFEKGALGGAPVDAILRRHMATLVGELRAPRIWIDLP